MQEANRVDEPHHSVGQPPPALRTLLERLEKAEASNRAKDELLAAVSHELRRPLAAIHGWVQVIRARRGDETITARAIETIERNVTAMIGLVGDLLDVSKIEARQLRLTLEPTALAPIIQAAVETALPAAEARGIRLECETLDPSCTVAGDPARLEQVVGNLIGNAVKFTRPGGRVTVRLVSRTDSEAEIAVADTGQGISPHLLPYIFDRFRQGAQPQGGLGLGLAIVRHLVELHGGGIQAESAGEGWGATFRVRLPLLAAPASPAGPNREPLAATPASADPLASLHVLVIEDEADTRNSLVLLLEAAGARVTGVASAEQALGVLDLAPPDVLLCDIGLPGRDGYQFIREVRGRRAEDGGLTPAAALTARAGVEDRRRALDAGFDLHVAKPLSLSQLVEVVGHLAGRMPGIRLGRVTSGPG